MEIEERLASLERRVAELEDERAIRDVLSCYGYTADNKRDDLWLDLFTVDGAMDVSTGGLLGYHGVRLWQGRDELSEFIEDPDAHRRPDKYGKDMHLHGNNVVTRIDGDAAIVTSYSVMLQDTPDGIVVTSAGNTRWLLAQADGRWRIKERRRRHIGTAEFWSNVDETMLDA
jgi:hypothetical protein